MEIGNGTSKVKNSENIEVEKNANGNQAVSLGVAFLVRMLSICLSGTLILFRMGIFRPAHGRWGVKKASSLKSVTHILQ